MILVFCSPEQADKTVLLNNIPARAVVHGILFWVFTHVWITAFKKQMKNLVIKKKTYQIVISIAVSFALLSEFAPFVFINGSVFNYWNLIFDFLGIFIGLISFRLLYTKCY